MNNVLDVKKLTYKSIFKDLDFHIEKNTTNLIIGSNKCGKTTLIKILGRVIDVEGCCYFNNKDIFSMKSLEYSTNFSCVIFDGNFNFNNIVLEDEFMYNLDKCNLTGSERKMKYKNLAKIFNLSNSVDKKIYELSFFDKIKSLVMFSVISNPKVLLLDNIIDDLSDSEAIELLEMIKKVGGITVIISSDKFSISPIFDYIHVIDAGKMVLSGKALDILKEDSILNKIGLVLPFMVDLSVKLKYYGLVDDIILELNRMVDKLWK